MAQKNASINIDVKVDENKVPETIRWSAEDGGIRDEEAKALMLSVWDARAKGSLRIDLWTKDMPVDEMKQFFSESLLAMADTYERATGDEKLSGDFRDFGGYFAEKIKNQNEG